MDVKAILKRWGRSRDRIARLTGDMKEIVDRLDAVADIRPQNFDGMPHGTEISNPTERAAFERMQIMDECRDRMREIVDLLKDEETFELRVEGCFVFLSVPQERVVRMRYRDRKTQEAVAEYMEYSARHVQRLEHDAVEILEVVFHETGLL